MGSLEGREPQTEGIQRNEESGPEWEGALRGSTLLPAPLLEVREQGWWQGELKIPALKGRPGAWAWLPRPQGDFSCLLAQVCCGHSHLRVPGAATAPAELHNLRASPQRGGPQRKERACYSPHHRSVTPAAYSLGPK